MDKRTPTLSRRQLLKVGLLGTTLLATAGITASLTGCSDQRPGAGFHVLRESDLPFLQRVLPLLLAGAIDGQRQSAATQATLKSLDDMLMHFSPAMRDETLQLFDIMTLPLTRGPLTGIWSGWQQASDGAIRQFLQRWQNSRFDLLNKGHGALLQLVSIAWYCDEQAWAHCNYRTPVLE